MHQPGQPHPRVPRQPPLTRAGLVYLAGLTDSDGKLEAGPDLIDSASIDSAHGHQRLCHQFDPDGILPRPEQGRGQRPRAPQFGLGQLPQVGFRALAVHVLSVLPEARSSFLVAGLDRYWRRRRTMPVYVIAPTNDRGKSVSRITVRTTPRP